MDGCQRCQPASHRLRSPASLRGSSIAAAAAAGCYNSAKVFDSGAPRCEVAIVCERRYPGVALFGPRYNIPLYVVC